MSAFYNDEIEPLKPEAYLFAVLNYFGRDYRVPRGVEGFANAVVDVLTSPEWVELGKANPTYRELGSVFHSAFRDECNGIVREVVRKFGGESLLVNGRVNHIHCWSVDGATIGLDEPRRECIKNLATKVQADLAKKVKAA
jgi:hypothetical protein